MNETVQGWHFLAEDRRLGNGDGRLVEVGKTISIPKKRMLTLCIHGLHASERAIDALKYAPGPIVCRVEVLGEVERDNEKLCGYERRCLSMADATATLHEFACRCAEQALEHAVDDPRCWGAIDCKRRWMSGEATDEELSAACAAARDKEAARAASSAAAMAAASATAGAASSAAASAAAWAAASAAALDGAWASARAWQNDLLEQMLGELLPLGGSSHGCRM